MNNSWFKEAIIYQIYPQSFKDSNNDGIGDLQGIISKIDYLVSLGINCIWLSPIYVSPMADNGYDIADYYNINPIYGTIEDFKELIFKLHQNNIRLIMDLVVNHTSDEHRWFKEASSDKNSPYHDYYIFKDKPNNWTGFFGDKAWSYNEKTNEYYLHLFDKKQPDLNWENPLVRQEVQNICKYWLDLGVDGFRCDVINLISKDQEFKNGHNKLILVGKKYFINGPKLHDYLQELNEKVLSHYDCMTVGETVFTTLDDIKLLTDENRKELSMVFNFDHTSVDNFLGVKWLMRKFKLKRFKKILDKYQYGLENAGWYSIFYENHDQRRSVGRFNLDEKMANYTAPMLATTMYLLRGTPYIYQGQELGMTNLNVKDLDEFIDVETKDVLKLMKKLPLSKKYIDKSIRNGSRDNARTPFQWDDSEYAGFSNAKPWIMVNDNKDFINKEKEEKDENSILNYYKKLIRVYKENNLIIRDGKYNDLKPKSNKIFMYERILNEQRMIVISNFTSKTIKMKLPEDCQILLNNYQEIKNNFLLPYQTLVYLK